jgi:uncharacterized repeat protein (TIGR03803 family)
VLASFNGTNGFNPYAGLIVDAAGDLFGTTQRGGAGGYGAVFELAKTSSGYAAPTVLASFNGANGAYPAAGLIADAAGDLFGTTGSGGAYGDGTVFELAKTSSGYAAPTVLASFNGTNGADPSSELIADAAGDLFGTTISGGAYRDGTVFEITQSGFQIAAVPIITLITETPSTGDLGIGSEVMITLTTSEPLIATGGFGTTLSLNDGGTATYDAAKSTASSFVFDYTVEAGQNTSSLAVTAVNLNGVTATDAAGHPVNTSLVGLAQVGPQIDTIAPTITSVTEIPATGDLGIGRELAITLTTNKPLIASGGFGTTLSLNDGGTATYDAAKSTASSFVFDYTVEAGQNTPSLAVTAVNLNGVTATDAAGNPVNLSLTGLTQAGPQIDSIDPTITSVTETPSTGDLGIGSEVAISLTTSEPLIATGGFGTTLSLNDGGTATYDAAKSTASFFVFDYTAEAGQNTSSLAVTAVNLNGVTATDAAGHPVNTSLVGLTQVGPQIDTIVPTIASVTETPSTGDLGIGSKVAITLTTSKPLIASGGFGTTLSLNDGGTATYDAAKSTASSFVFDYTVGAGQNTPSLAVTAVNLNGVTATDAAGHPVNTSLAGLTQVGPGIDTVAPTITSVTETPATGDLGIGSAVTFTLTTSEPLIATGGVGPTLSLNNGGIATYDRANSTASSFVFDYTVEAGQNTPSLAVTAVNLNNVITATDAAGNAVKLSLAGLTQVGPQIDTNAPTSILVTLAEFNGTNGNGLNPEAGLIADAAGDLFGTTAGGGASQDGGTVFELAKTSSGYAAPKVLVSFNGANGTNGNSPIAGLLADAAGDLFGTTEWGGAGHDGTVFELAKTNSGYAAPTVLASFNGTNGANPYAGLIADAAGDLFGTTARGGASGVGTVFELAKTSSGYAAPKVLVSFNGTNGANPYAGLIADAAGDLFGTTESGGAGRDGTVFELAKTSSGYAAPTVLASFNGTSGNGANPYAGLITDAAGDLFGTTNYGGAGGHGTVFELAKTSSGYAAPKVLASFNGANGADPVAGLIADAAGDLFGTTERGGASGYGTVFELAKTSSGYAAPKVLASFNGVNGEYPVAGLIADAAGNLFGTTGVYGGTVFEITQSGFQIAPTITAVTETPATGDLGIGSEIAITLKISEPLIASGGFGTTLSLNDGGTATYDAAKSTASSFVFDYTVEAGQNTPSLAVTAVNLNGVTATDAAGNAVNTSLAGLTQAGPQIDTGEWTVSGTENLEIPSAFAKTATFAPGAAATLTLDQSTFFTGQIAGLTAQDTLDLRDIAFGSPTTLGYSANPTNTGGALSVSDGTHLATIALLGNYMASSFVAASDGHGGTLITDPSTTQHAVLALPHTG